MLRLIFTNEKTFSQYHNQRNFLKKNPYNFLADSLVKDSSKNSPRLLYHKKRALFFNNARRQTTFSTIANSKTLSRPLGFLMTLKTSFSILDIHIPLIFMSGVTFMNPITTIEQAYKAFLAQNYQLESTAHDAGTFALNSNPAKAAFGDASSNSALVIARLRKLTPQSVAREIVLNFSHEDIQRLEVAGPGFINFFFKPAVWHTIATNISTQKDLFFSEHTGERKGLYSIEYVSANPTGPLHFGHGRGGIIGDVLANVLTYLGYKVNREYYVNDAGGQMQKLSRSLKIRCQQAIGMDAQLNEESYHGEYIIDLAKTCIAEHGAAVVERDEDFFATYGKDKMLGAIKETLDSYGITFDTWFSEKTLHTGGAIIEALERLQKAGHLYDLDGATWFKSTSFGDDKDRVVRKSDGELTYAAADIAYMLNKIDRGASHLVMILGHDHHSYAIRLDSIRRALGLDDVELDVILYQLVKMKTNGEMVRMSKRAGNIVTLKDIVDTVGKDVARFFFLNRKGDAQLDFDLNLALTSSEENPVFYLHYAYVRTNSIFAKANEHEVLRTITVTDSVGMDEQDRALIRKIVELKSVLNTITTSMQTHLLAYYALELAQQFHAYYGKNKIVDAENVATSRARLFTVGLTHEALARVLTLLGLSLPEKM